MNFVYTTIAYFSVIIPLNNDNNNDKSQTVVILNRNVYVSVIIKAILCKFYVPNYIVFQLQWVVGRLFKEDGQ